MSTFHLMRNFIALLRTLGYSRFISLENFRRPNFPLMADILCYLLKRFDSTLEITAKIDTEQERLAFVRAASQIMVSKAHLDVNTKKLYMADVNSVPEMLKLAKLIYDAWRALKAQLASKSGGEDLRGEDSAENSGVETSFDRNMYNNFKTNQLTSEILQMGTQLFDILAEEDANKAQRQQVLGRQIVIENIEANLRASIGQLQSEMSSMQERKESLDQDSEDLNLKLERKAAELGRNRKRLQTLTAQRPVFMDELERVEADIGQLYDDYVINSRCLFFLEQKLEEFEEVERMKIEERNEEIKQMLEQMRADEFLKEGREIKVNGGGGDGGGGGGDGDHLVLLEDDEVDIPSDDGEGSDISDAMARDLDKAPGGRSKTLGIIGPQTTTTNTKKLAMMGSNGVGGKNGSGMGVLTKKGGDRSLLAGTTVVNRREPRSSKTARIYSYGSLLADDDDDGEDELPEDGEDGDEESEALSKGSIAKMTDSEIDLDAIEDDSDEEEDGSENLNLSDDFAPNGRSKVPNNHNPNPNNGPTMPAAARLTGKFSFESKSDDNF